MKKIKPKVIIVCGPTASGKSDFAINLVRNKFFGEAEIISADSRQVYKGLEFFSGAILEKEMRGIKHHLISFLDINENFTVFNFQREATKIIQKIIKKDKIPIIVGGSGFFMESLIYKNLLPEIDPNKKLREKLEKKNTEELYKMLLKQDKKRAENIDKKNKRRLIRSLEIIDKIGFFPIIQREINDNYTFEIYYSNLTKEVLNKKIEENFLRRVDKLIKEGEKINKIVSKKKFKQLGLAFKFINDFWDNKISKDEFIKLGIREEQKYAKRQKTFLKKFLENLPKDIKKFDF